MNAVKFLAVVLFANCGLAGELLAQDVRESKPEIVTDRPDQTESSTLVPVGALQVETGFMLESDKTGPYNVKDYTYNTTLIKYGLSENFEFRLIQEYLGNKTLASGEIDRSRGFSPVSIGTKIKIADARKYLPQIAFIGHITLPTGSEGFNPTYISSDFRFTIEYDITDKLSTGLNLGAERDGELPITTGIYTMVVGYSPFKKIGIFAELYGFLTEKPSTEAHHHHFNGGITYAISDVVQYDASAGVGISETSADYFVSTGISFRMFK